ncbi:hypothetical protein [Luteolibacter sp. LG18]|uniref:hypothetical protein n=1 Tax=Luteolibacter sp. LG18 TaxID=2819286 RepID=UPI002B2A29B2|nr:hypothetical protein llg_30070 [Luteolibacter sp. LG18]
MRALFLCGMLTAVCPAADPIAAAPMEKVPATFPARPADAKSATPEDAAAQAKADPAKGLQWLGENGGYEPGTGEPLLKAFVSEVVKADPRQAIEFYDRFSPGHPRSAYVAELARTLDAKDLTAAWQDYRAHREDEAVRAVTAPRLIAIQSARGVGRAWEVYGTHEPTPDKKLFFANLCIAPGKRATEDTVFSLNMMRTVQNCAKCEAAFEVFVCNADGKDMALLTDYLAAHPKREKLDPAYGSLARKCLAEKRCVDAAKWISRMVKPDQELLVKLNDSLQDNPAHRKTIAGQFPDLPTPDKAPPPAPEVR